MGFKLGFGGGFCLAVGEGSPLPLYEKTFCYLQFFTYLGRGDPSPTMDRSCPINCNVTVQPTFKFGFVGLTEQIRIGKGDPHPSRLRRATFPQGKASSQVCSSFS